MSQINTIKNQNQNNNFSSSSFSSNTENSEIKADHKTDLKTNLKTNLKADELIVKAEKRMKPNFASFLLSNSNTRYTEAAEMYIKAGALYKINKNWNEAGKAYVCAAKIYFKDLQSPQEACLHYIEAAVAYKHCNTLCAIQNYQLAVQLRMEENQFCLAAKLWREIGDLYKKDLSFYDAIRMYQKAIDCYDAEDKKVNSRELYSIIADILIEQEQYEQAVKIYEQVIELSLQMINGKWKIKEYCFKTLLCTLIISVQKDNLNLLEDKMNEYKNNVLELEGTLDIKFIENLKQTIDEEDIDAFKTLIQKYDSICKLDSWIIKLLVNIKTILEQGLPNSKEQKENEEDPVGV